jgi:hypothetical protein
MDAGPGVYQTGSTPSESHHQLKRGMKRGILLFEWKGLPALKMPETSFSQLSPAWTDEVGNQPNCLAVL